MESELLDFSTKPAQDIFVSLESSLSVLAKLRENALVQTATSTSVSASSVNAAVVANEGVKKFESLCRGIVSSVQELSLRIAKLSESDKDIRPLAADCRKILLDVSTSLMLVTSTAAPNGPKSPSHIRNNTFPTLVDKTLPMLLQGCKKALITAEQMNSKKVREMGEPVLHTLAHLQRCGPDNDDVFLSLKLFGIRLLKFLEACSIRHRDFIQTSRQIGAVTQAESVKKLAPYLVQSLRDAIQKPKNPHLRDCKDFFFNAAQKSVENLMRLFESSEAIPEQDMIEPAGTFVKKMDLVLEDLKSVESCFSTTTVDKVRDSTEWIVRFALSVSKACPRDDADVFDACRNVVAELEALKSMSESSIIGTTLLREALEQVEHAVNVALLRLIVITFSRSHCPMDLLLTEIIKKSELNEQLVEALDEHNDDLFHVAHFSRYCATDRLKSQDILSRLQILEVLEKELVPTCHRFFHNKTDSGAGSYLKTMRAFWKAEFDAIEVTILDIVDATALCAVIDEEVRSLAVEVKKQIFSQDFEWIRLASARLIKMCQMAVDAAWKEVANGDSDKQLPDDHPVIKLERSTWEVRSAMALVLHNSDNVNAHKSFIRRVQLLATSTSNIVKFLISIGEDDPETGNSATNVEDIWHTTIDKTGQHVTRSSSVRVLTSVSRVTIGSPIVSELTRRKIARRNHSTRIERPPGDASRLGTRSFRLNKTTGKDDRIRPRQVGRASQLIDETLSRLTNLTPKMPYQTRKNSSGIASNSRLKVAKNFALSNILNSPRPSPIGCESPTIKKSEKISRSPLKIITNTEGNKSMKSKVAIDLAKTFGLHSTSTSISTPDRMADLDLIDRRLDLLLKTS